MTSTRGLMKGHDYMVYRFFSLLFFGKSVPSQQLFSYYDNMDSDRFPANTGQTFFPASVGSQPTPYEKLDSERFFSTTGRPFISAFVGS